MAEAKHTPGPWFVGDLMGMSFPIRSNPEWGSGSWLADVHSTHVGPADPDEAVANARLIAAAPELLTSLKALASAGEGLVYRAYLEDAYAAISKAERAQELKL